MNSYIKITEMIEHINTKNVYNTIIQLQKIRDLIQVDMDNNQDFFDVDIEIGELLMYICDCIENIKKLI